MHVGLLVYPQAQHTSKHRGPLVLGSQTHLHLFRSSKDPLVMGILLYLCPPAESLAFHVCPATQPIMILHTLLSHEFSTPFCRSVSLSRPGSLFTPCFQPQTLFRISSSVFLGFLQQLPVSVLLFPALNFLLFIPTLFPQTLQQVVSFSQGVGHGL